MGLSGAGLGEAFLRSTLNRIGLQYCALQNSASVALLTRAAMNQGQLNLPHNAIFLRGIFSLPKRLKVGVVEALLLFSLLAQVEAGARNNVVDLPIRISALSAVVLPRHSGLKSTLEVGYEMGDGTSNHFRSLSAAFSSVYNGYDSLPHIVFQQVCWVRRLPLLPAFVAGADLVSVDFSVGNSPSLIKGYVRRSVFLFVAIGLSLASLKFFGDEPYLDKSNSSSFLTGSPERRKIVIADSSFLGANVVSHLRWTENDDISVSLSRGVKPGSRFAEISKMLPN